MNWKQIIRIISFSLVLILVFVALSDVFETEDTLIAQRYNLFKTFSPGMIDAVYIGTSAVDRYFITAKAYDDYGMAVYDVSSDSMPAYAYLPLVKEVLRYQQPKLFIFDIRPFVTSPSATTSMANARKVIDTLDFFSPGRFEMISRTAKHLHQLDPDNYGLIQPDLLFTFLSDHGKWDEDDFSIVNQPVSKYLGYHLSTTIATGIQTLKASVYAEEMNALDEANEEYLLELITFAREKNLNILFVDNPHYVDEAKSSVTDTIFYLLEDEDIPYLNLNTDEIIAQYFNREKDFYNQGHVNYNGAVKFTDLFAKWLHENYDFPDHREDSAYAEWNGVYNKIQKQVKKLRDKNKK